MTSPRPLGGTAPRLEVRLEAGDVTRRVGSLLAVGPQIYFEYDPGFLTTGIEISPFKLKLGPGVLSNGERHFNGLWGVFDDSLPDTWGLLLLRRELEGRGLHPDGVPPLGLLRYLGTRTGGALTYHPPEGPEDTDPGVLALDEAAAQAERLYEGSAEDVLPALRQAGGPSGGARPKALIAINADGHVLAGTGRVPDGYHHYLVKFPTREDRRDAGPVELAYADMARAGGVQMPPTRRLPLPGGSDCFAVERFDRDPGAPNRRRHLHSLAGLLHADYKVPGTDYKHLLQVTNLLTRDHAQVLEAFRRMVFNVLACNRDDHAKNFAFLMDETGTWTLAPAYDVMYEPRLQAYEWHTTAIRGVALHPSMRDVLALADETDIAPAAARTIVSEVAEAVGTWESIAKGAGVSPARRSQIAASLHAIRRVFDQPPTSPRMPKAR